MICPKCHSENRDDAKFCNECGTSLAPGEAEAHDEGDAAPSGPLNPASLPEIAVEGVNVDGEGNRFDPASISADAADDRPGETSGGAAEGDASPENRPDANPAEGPAPAQRKDEAAKTQAIDLSGFDECLVDAGYVPPAASWRSGDTMKMPAVEGDGASSTRQKEFRAPDAPGKKGGKGKTIAIALSIVLVLAAVAAGATYQMELWGGRMVPDVVGMTQADATYTLEGKGFSARATQVKSDETEGLVLLMDPGAGSRREEGAEVVIHVAAGRAVPEVLGLSEDEAAAALEQEGLDKATFVYEKSDEPKGTVLAIDPAPGEKVRAATPITVTVAQPYTVPDVAGMDPDGALAALEGESLVGSVSYVYSEEASPGSVLGTEPVAGTEVASGTEVSVLVAKSRASELVEAAKALLASGRSVKIDGVDYLISSCDAVAYEGGDTVSYTITAQPYTYLLGVMLPLEARAVSGTIVWDADNRIAGGTPSIAAA